MPNGEEAIGRKLYLIEDTIMFGRLLKTFEQFKKRQADEGRHALAALAGMWNEFVSTYSATRLTFSSDRLAGLSELRQLLSKSFDGIRRWYVDVNSSSHSPLDAIDAEWRPDGPTWSETCTFLVMGFNRR
jgi:hypothetical protein